MSTPERRVVVTGAGGFVGRNIVRELVGRGISVFGTYRSAPPRELEQLAALKGCELVFTDLADAPRLPDGVEAIIHTAAQATASGKPVADYVRNNVRATQNVADYAVRSGVKRIVNLSSLSVYGQIRSQVVDESTEILNPSPYGASKHLGELVLEEIGSVVPSVSLRLPGILGPAADGPWLAKVHRAARNNEEVVIFHPEAAFNNAVHVEDLSRFVAALVDRQWSGADVLTLACSEPVSVRETVQQVIDLCGSASSVTATESSSTSFVISNDRAVREYRYRPPAVKDVVARFVHENA